jgi:hypothetical protein
MLPLYEDFRQKRQLAKLVKLAKDKAQLPIAAEHDAIVVRPPHCPAWHTSTFAPTFPC